MFKDKNLKCSDCGDKFVFSASEQQFFAEKGFTNEPKRCPQCRAANKKRNKGGSFESKSRRQREMFTTECADCGAKAKVPFKPSDDQPLYCIDCYKKRKEAQEM